MFTFIMFWAKCTKHKNLVGAKPYLLRIVRMAHLTV
jgi:hypothetical protein